MSDLIVKYKVSDFAKDLNLSAKKVLDELAAMGSTRKKNSSNLEENELTTCWKSSARTTAWQIWTSF